MNHLGTKAAQPTLAPIFKAHMARVETGSATWRGGSNGCDGDMERHVTRVRRVWVGPEQRGGSAIATTGAHLVYPAPRVEGARGNG